MSSILPILDCIKTIQDEEIMQHREQVLAALERIERVLQLPQRVGTWVSDGQIDQDPRSLATTDGSDLENDSDGYAKNCEKILHTIRKRLSTIQDYATQTIKQAVGDAPQKSEDPRVLDAQVYDGARKKSSTLSFRRTLAIRSLCIEFSRFQKDRLGHSRISWQINHLSSDADQSQDGTIEQFLESKKHITDRGMAKRMIIQGSKMIVLEGLYGHCGVSAILWYVPSWSRLGYPELPILLELLLFKPEFHDIKMMVEDFSGWYEKCQTQYDRNVMAEYRALASPRNGLRPSIRKRKNDETPAVGSKSAKRCRPGETSQVFPPPSDMVPSSTNVADGHHECHEPLRCVGNPQEGSSLPDTNNNPLVRHDQLTPRLDGTINFSPLGGRGRLCNDIQHIEDCRLRHSAMASNGSIPQEDTALPNYALSGPQTNNQVASLERDTTAFSEPLGATSNRAANSGATSTPEFLRPAELVDFMSVPTVPPDISSIVGTSIHPTNLADFVDTSIQSTDLVGFVGTSTHPAGLHNVVSTSIHPTGLADFVGTSIHPTDLADFVDTSTHPPDLADSGEPPIHPPGIISFTDVSSDSAHSIPHTESECANRPRTNWPHYAATDPNRLLAGQYYSFQTLDRPITPIANMNLPYAAL